MKSCRQPVIKKKQHSFCLVIKRNWISFVTDSSYYQQQLATQLAPITIKVQKYKKTTKSVHKKLFNILKKGQRVYDTLSTNERTNEKDIYIKNSIELFYCVRLLVCMKKEGSFDVVVWISWNVFCLLAFFWSCCVHLLRMRREIMQNWCRITQKVIPAFSFSLFCLLFCFLYLKRIEIFQIL